MKLAEALGIANAARSLPGPRRFVLATGFTPLHLGTFLRAFLQQRHPDERVRKSIPSRETAIRLDGEPSDVPLTSAE